MHEKRGGQRGGEGRRMRAAGGAARRIAVLDFGRWIRGSRLLILGMMLVFVHMLVIVPLADCSQRMGEPLSLMEAFVALGNSGAVILVIPLLYLVLMADFPRQEKVDLMIQFRCSKRGWVGGQLLFAGMVSAFLVAFLAVSSVIMLSPWGRFHGEFSEAVRYYSYRFPERSGDFVLQLLPENLYQQMSLGTAVRHTLLLMLLYFLMLALVLLFASLCARRYAGIVADCALIVLGAATCSARVKMMWLFPMAHTISWVHYDKYLSRMEFPVWGSYLYMTAAVAALAVGCLAVSKTYQAGKGEEK